jgi:hypothetical protein
MQRKWNDTTLSSSKYVFLTKHPKNSPLDDKGILKIHFVEYNDFTSCNLMFKITCELNIEQTNDVKCKSQECSEIQSLGYCVRQLDIGFTREQSVQTTSTLSTGNMGMVTVKKI